MRDCAMAPLRVLARYSEVGGPFSTGILDVRIVPDIAAHVVAEFEGVSDAVVTLAGQSRDERPLDLLDLLRAATRSEDGDRLVSARQVLTLYWLGCIAREDGDTQDQIRLIRYLGLGEDMRGRRRRGYRSWVELDTMEYIADDEGRSIDAAEAARLAPEIAAQVTDPASRWAYNCRIPYFPPVRDGSWLS